MSQRRLLNSNWYRWSSWRISSH